MKKFTIVLVFFLLLLTSFCIIASANDMHLKMFKGLNGETFNLYYKEDINTVNNKNNNEVGDRVFHEVGDIIYNNGMKEIVIAVSDDGSFISSPYQESIQ